ncbi:hypothetical protein CB1_001331019 [Camelus ferus]|nr:hypothetical protein CB1_001331019 [Camelus ferus]
MDPLELSNVNIEPDEESTSGESVQGSYTGTGNLEKAAMSSQFANEDAESQKFLTNGFLGPKKLTDYDDEHHPGTTSFGMSSFNLSNAIMGSGILGLSYAMANTGIILFIEWYLNGNYLIIFVSVGIILPLSLLKNLGYLGYTSGFSLTCMVFFVSVVIYKKFQIPCPLPVLDHNAGNLTFNNSLPMHVVTLPNNSESRGVNFMMDYTHRNPAGLDENQAKGSVHGSGVEYEAHGDKCQPRYFVFNSRTAYAIPILAFAFVCHPEVLPIYSELKDRSRRKMQTVSNVSITGMLIMYLLAALFGYLTFYGEVEDELLHGYSKVYTFDTPLLMVRLAVLVAVTLTVPIVLFPQKRRLFSWLTFAMNISSGSCQFVSVEQRPLSGAAGTALWIISRSRLCPDTAKGSCRDP